jgi:hypothetical protein
MSYPSFTRLSRQYFSKSAVVTIPPQPAQPATQTTGNTTALPASASGDNSLSVSYTQKPAPAPENSGRRVGQAENLLEHNSTPTLDDFINGQGKGQGNKNQNQ